ncbi:polysaccharide deacetylase family protein [Fundicoccus culcitae]|uniref:Polysaccharide deacetylase family protein n=1 Tax=Fundicoccus culcitae TaxID=2969821 RepID=A0ABY5P330_9LACT|nr:polysaccharide deacetylase family protein [Fundicoccus culcitae]UUX33102.1 polysaccharide deacetylase family protein [Fundicoccus culcitae]
MNLVKKLYRHCQQRFGPKSLLLVACLILGLYILLVIVLPFNAPYQIQAVENSLQSLYQDETQSHLRHAVEPSEIDHLNRQASHLKGQHRTDLMPKVELVSQKLLAQERLDLLYQSDTVFYPDVDSDMIEAFTQPIEWSMEDVATQEFDKLTLQAQNQWQVIANVNQDMATIKNHTHMTRQQIPTIIQKIQDINSQLDFVQEQPHIQDNLADYQRFLDLFIEELTASHQRQPYSNETLMPLFESDYMTTMLEGTTLDVRPKIALTFDDGPNDQYTPQVLDILNKYHIQGTFFVVGRNVETYPETAKQIVDEGHIIANHSYDHPNFTEISDHDVRNQINVTQDIIYTTTGVRPSLYRMPYGAGGERVYRLIPELTSITWNTDTEDWEVRDSEKIYQNIIRQLSDDMLILLHDTNQASVDALEPLIEYLNQHHYRFVAPTELEYDYRY